VVQLQHYQVLGTYSELATVVYIFQLLGYKNISWLSIHFGHPFSDQTEYKLVKDWKQTTQWTVWMYQVAAISYISFWVARCCHYCHSDTR